MNIRNATRADLVSVKRLRPDLGDAELNGRLDRQGQGITEFLILEDDEEVCSFVVLKWDGKATHPEYPDLEDLYTVSGKRGKGYATSLIRRCEALAKEKGYQKIGLGTNPTLNAYARKLYEYLGYIHDGKASYLDGVYGGVEDWCIDLEKSFG